jgi:hypothetical protein
MRGRKVFKDLILNNFVSCNLAASSTHRDLIRKVARESKKTIPIESLPNSLNRQLSSRARVVFGFPGNSFDQIARNYDRVWWWVSDKGLNMKVVADSGPDISPFDKLAGRLMFEARPHRLSNGRLQAAEYGRIATFLDQAGFKPLDYLEGKFRNKLADWNQKNPRRALHTFKAVLESKLSLPRRGVLKRLYRAESIWVEVTESSDH